jgi:hypothetical protein
MTSPDLSLLRWSLLLIVCHRLPHTLPTHCLDSFNEPKVAITRNQWVPGLTAERGDPKIIGGDRLASNFQFPADLRVATGGFASQPEDFYEPEVLIEPFLIVRPSPGPLNSKLKFPQHDHGDQYYGMAIQHSPQLFVTFG